MSKTKIVPNPVSGYEAYSWPETQALLKRLGIDYSAFTKTITITFPADGCVLVAHDYLGVDRHLVKTDDSTAQERTNP